MVSFFYLSNLLYIYPELFITTPSAHAMMSFPKCSDISGKHSVPLPGNLSRGGQTCLLATSQLLLSLATFHGFFLYLILAFSLLYPPSFYQSISSKNVLRKSFINMTPRFRILRASYPVFQLLLQPREPQFLLCM